MPLPDAAVKFFSPFFGPLKCHKPHANPHATEYKMPGIQASLNRQLMPPLTHFIYERKISAMAKKASKHFQLPLVRQVKNSFNQYCL